MSEKAKRCGFWLGYGGCLPRETTDPDQGTWILATDAERLERENEELELELEILGGEKVTAESRAEAAERLLETCREYAGHSEGCSARFNDPIAQTAAPYRCRCRWDEERVEIDAHLAARKEMT